MAAGTRRDLTTLLEPTAVRATIGVVGVLVSLSVARGLTEERGVAIGVVAGLFYGALMLSVAVSPQGLARWSSRHVVADAALFVPLAFFALLLVRPLSWWWAALAALGLGAVVVPLMVRRRWLLSRNDGRRQRWRQGQREGIKTVPEEVLLRLDRVTATHLAVMLYNVGEHLAAGRPIASMSTEESEQLGRVLDDLRRALLGADMRAP